MSRAPAILFTFLGAVALVFDVVQQLAAPNSASPQWWFAWACIGLGAIISRLERIARSLSAMGQQRQLRLLRCPHPLHALVRDAPR